MARHKLPAVSFVPSTVSSAPAVAPGVVELAPGSTPLHSATELGLEAKVLFFFFLIFVFFFHARQSKVLFSLRSSLLSSATVR